MSSLGLGIIATSLLLILIFIWMVSLSMRKKRLETEKKQREAAYRQAIQKARQQEQQDREFKAETGHVPTILYLAKEAEKGNLSKALYWYKKAAHLDNVTGMYGVIRLSERMRDDIVLKQQINFWRLAIKGIEGDLEAKLSAGTALVTGSGVEKNIAKGIEWIEGAATEGYLPAIIYMGEWQSSPQNAHPKPNDALSWFVKAVEQGSTEGKINLARCYLQGIGAQHSLLNGRYWLERAAEDGHVEAMYLAGEAWLEQEDTGKFIAYIWLFLSTSLGFDKARPLRDDVASQIGIDVVVGLQSIAKPILHKLSSGALKPHTIIRALDKIYKRVPFTPSEVVGVQEFQSNAPESFEENLTSINDQQNSSKLEEKPLSKDALDFTHTFLQPQQTKPPQF
ncbi:hypothetical protein BS333_14435 [Vibrio azureus]|uniref:Sel1 repeat family protein n=1 Tax=Vibrio azureus NBRC 104587 TaxID=1219077 RepID=U3C800_9VIBR|nr:tetratricopeptide repeat protein [Vibrio azureus]AUI87608.1 hypothetical protein BS333_14435 [Vibrio azureus]GAD74583.1 hypothetical protein VAZ01S_012_00640 [Vibrio azureus NBRC 104587]